jgi:hypothetical protein
MIEVELTEYELQMGASVGVRRHIEALAKGLPDKHGFDEVGWNIHVEGALGELAVGKAIGRFWNGSSGTFKQGGDLGLVQVRTRSKHHYDLIVRDADRDEDVFILCTGTAPKYCVWGWTYGADAKKPEFAQTYGGRPVAFFVPKANLNPLDPT